MCGAGGADRAAAQGAGVTGNGLLRGGADSEELQRTQNGGGPGPSEGRGAGQPWGGPQRSRKPQPSPHQQKTKRLQATGSGLGAETCTDTTEGTPCPGRPGPAGLTRNWPTKAHTNHTSMISEKQRKKQRMEQQNNPQMRSRKENEACTIGRAPRIAALKVQGLNEITKRRTLERWATVNSGPSHFLPTSTNGAALSCSSACVPVG